MVKERKSQGELRQLVLAEAREREECRDLEDLFIFGPAPRPNANWGFGIAGKDNKVSVACYTCLNEIAGALQARYELHPVKVAQREIEARVWSLIQDQPILKASLSQADDVYELAVFRRLDGQPNWTMEWLTGDQHAKAAFERIIRSVQTQIELE